MNLLLVALGIALSCEIFSGCFVLSLNHSSHVNRAFFAWSVAAAIWTISVIFLSLSRNLQDFLLHFKIMYICFLPFFSLFLHFVLLLVNRRLKWFHFGLIYLLPALLFYPICNGCFLFKDIVRSGEFWTFQYNFDSPWTILSFVYRTVIFWGSIAVLWGWRRRSRKNRERRQAMVLLSTMITLDISLLLVYIILRLKIIGTEPLFILVWIAGVFFAIVRFQFMKLSPGLVVDTLMDHMNDVIILMDEELNVNYLNSRAVSLLGVEPGGVLTRPFSQIVLEHASLRDELKVILQGENTDFVSRIHLNRLRGDAVFLDARFSAVIDRFGDSLGILLIGHEVKEGEQFRKRFKITKREAEIVQRMLTGQTNPDISRALGISLRTVKSHITNIYNKLKVNNKLEMMNLLKEYKLIPDRNSSRMILPIQKK